MTKSILFIISRFLDGGIETVLVEIIRMLAADERYSLTLAVAIKMDGLEVYHDRLPNNVRIEYLVDEPLLCLPKVRRFKKQSGALEILADEIFLTSVRRMLQKRRLQQLIAENDVVVDFDACHTAFLTRCRKPTVAWMHFSLQKLMEQNRRRTLRIVKRLTQYSKVVLICKAMQEEADRLFPELKGKTTFIYNAIDQEALRQRSAANVPASHAWLLHHPYILAVERLEESQKDITTLLKAYSMLDVHEHLVIIGKGKDEQRLKDYARLLGLTGSDESSSRVHFLGFQPNPHVYMAHASMLVHSAKFEGFGLAIAEALLLGLPVVATDCPVGPDEILDNGYAGLLTPIGDASALAAAIRELLTDATLRTEILAHAALHGKRFTKAEVKPQLDELLTP